MLHGRESEQDRIRSLLAEARDSRGGALVIVGEPGIGKSALLDDAIEHAGAMQVVSAAGLAAPGAGQVEL